MDKPGPYRYLILLGAVFLQLCLGATYSWAVFVEPMRQQYSLGQAWVQLPFFVFYVVFPLTMIFAARLLEWRGPRQAALIGVALFAGGWLVAGLTASQGFVAVVGGVGVLAGLGAGIAYVIPIWVGVQWFPRSKGLVTGVAVAGFGGGAALVSLIARQMMGGLGLPASAVFRFAGLFFAVLGGLSALLFRLPGPPPAPPPERPSGVHREPGFQRLYLAMFAGLCAGFAINANLKQIFPEATLHHGAVAVALFAISNALGRICWGFLHDRHRGVLFLRVNLVAQGATLVMGALGPGSPATFYLFAGLAGFNYGGVLVLYAAEAERRWGTARLARVYGLLFSSNIPAAVAPVLVGLSFDHTGGFVAGFLTLVGLLLLATTVIPSGETEP